MGSYGYEPRKIQSYRVSAAIAIVVCCHSFLAHRTTSYHMRGVEAGDLGNRK